LLVALDVGSARIACAVSDVSGPKPSVIAVETAASYGIRSGEIIDIARASESIRIAIAAAADRAEADVRSVVVGLSGDVKLTTSKAAIDLGERRCASASDIDRLRRGVPSEAPATRRIIHRYEGPFSIGDLHGVENPEGLSGDRLEMHASFLSGPSDRLDNVLKAVRAANVDIEAVSLEPISCSLGSLSPDERMLGAAVLDFGAGAFRGALWEGGRLRQIHIAAGDQSPTKSGRGFPVSGAPAGGMESIVMSLARRFRIAPMTAGRLLLSHGALNEAALAQLPATAEVTAVDGLGSVRIETRELSVMLEELLAPLVRSMREGLSGFSAAHAGGIVLTGGGARIRGMTDWVSKRFNGAPVREGVPRWELNSGVTMPAELSQCSACSLSGIVALGAEGRERVRRPSGTAWLARVGESLRRLTASL
jgi:cell division protein FtsA